MESNKRISIFRNACGGLNRVSTPISFDVNKDFSEYFDSIQCQNNFGGEDEVKDFFQDPVEPETFRMTFDFRQEMAQSEEKYSFNDSPQLLSDVDMMEDDEINGFEALNFFHHTSINEDNECAIEELTNNGKYDQKENNQERFLSNKQTKALSTFDDIENLVLDMQSCHINESSTTALSDITSISDDDFDLNSDNFFDCPEVECGDVEEEKILSVDEIIAEMPVDDPLLFILRFRRPINRDPNARVAKMFLPNNFEDLPIYLAEIFDPAHFWCQIAYSRKVKDINYNFDVFQQELNDTYRKLKKRDLQFSIENVKKGMICVGYFTEFNNWYRIRILDFDTRNEMAKVFCIDYGTKSFLKRGRLKYLFEDFLNYPEYCFRGRLHEVQPPEGFRYFKPTNVEKFIAAVSTKRFFATFKRYDEEENAYEMSLVRSTDHMSMKSFVLNENIGSLIDPQQYDRKICLGPLCYLLPTFDMLENDYPCYVDLYEMQSEGLNFNAVVDSNFFQAITLGEVEKNWELTIAAKHRKFRKSYKYVYGRSPPA